MSDIKQASAMLAMAHRDLKALGGMVLLRNAGADVDAYWWLGEFTIFAHQARYEEGHQAADVPLDRQKLVDEIGALVRKISHKIELLVSMPTQQVRP